MTPTGLRKRSMPASWRRHKGVPRFYMHVRYRDRLFLDKEGDELAHEHTVREHALATARDLVAHARLGSIRSWFDCAFEVTDQAARVVLVMPFSDTINESEATRGRGTDQGLINEPNKL